MAVARSSALRAEFRLAAAALAGCLALPVGAAPFAYVTNQASDDVAVIDLPSGNRVATLAVGRAPAGVEIGRASCRERV